MTNKMYQDLDVKGIIDAINGSNELIAVLRKQAIPIGASMYCVESPAAYYGGTWEEKDKDKFPLAAGDTYAAGSTGGEANHTLIRNEMPSHNHLGLYQYSAGPFRWKNGSESGFSIEYSTNEAAGSPITTGIDGGDQPHNNMPPYAAKKFWTKIA